MSKRFKIELALFLHEYAKNTWDCDGFDLLNERSKEWLKYEIVDELDKLLRL